MKTSKLYDILSWAFLGVLVVAEILAGAFLARLNMLPTLYNVLLIVLAVLLTGGTAALLFVGKHGTKGFLVRRIIGWALVILVVVGCVVISVVVADVYDTLSGMVDTQPEEDGVVRTVIVLKDDPAQNLADAAQYRFGVVKDYDTYYTGKAVEKLQQELGKQITLVEFDSMPELLDALLAKQVEAIILSQGILDTAKELEQYADLPDKIRFLYDAVIPEQIINPSDETTVPEDTTGPEETTGSDVTEPPVVTLPTYSGPITERPFIVYFSGSDSRDTVISNSGRSDVNILVVVNPQTKQVLLISTPRDSFVPNPALEYQYDKLTHCGNAGIGNTIRTLENLYGVKTDYNARINFTGFVTLIDAIGGITVYSPVAFQDGNKIYQFVKGDNHLDGEAALAFARERYAFLSGDFTRAENQMRVIKAVISKVTSGPTIIANYSAILDSIKGMFSMSLKMSEVSELVKMQLTDMASWEVFSYGVQGSSPPGGEITASWPGQRLSVVKLYDSHVARAKNAIAKIMSGEKLTQKDVS